jgi:hypothetical protein
MIVPAMANGDSDDSRQTISPGERNAGTPRPACATAYQHRVSTVLIIVKSVLA